MVALLPLLWLVAAGPAAAQVHRWVDERGVVQYGDRPPAGGAVTLRLNTAQPSTTPGAAHAPPPATAGATPPASPASRTRPPQPREAAPAGTIDRLLARQQPAGRAGINDVTDPRSPGMQQPVAQCKANRGVDCDTPQGMRRMQQENTPPTREEQARIAGLRARRLACARTPHSLGC
jgi:hypothetical protein